MMTKSRKEIIGRVMHNLEFINEHASQRGPFQVTQLLSSFMLTLHLNWDGLSNKWSRLHDIGVTWPEIDQEGLKQPRQAIKKLRDALAHGLVSFETRDGRDITHVHFWTACDRKTVDWNAELSVAEIEQMLRCFNEVAKSEIGDLKLPLKKGDLVTAKEVE